MKEAISFILVLILALTCVAALADKTGDAFALRDGIHFGDTAEEVRQEETLSFLEDYGDRILFEGEIAGFPNAQVNYYIEDSQLTRVMYRFYGKKAPQFASDEAMRALYASVQQILVDKYGEPLDKEDTTANAFTGFVKDVIFKHMYEDDCFSYDYDEWVIPGDGSSVKIEMTYCASNGADTGYEDHYTLTVGFQIFTNADVQ